MYLQSLNFAVPVIVWFVPYEVLVDSVLGVDCVLQEVKRNYLSKLA